MSQPISCEVKPRKYWLVAQPIRPARRFVGNPLQIRQAGRVLGFMKPRIWRSYKHIRLAWGKR